MKIKRKKFVSSPPINKNNFLQLQAKILYRNHVFKFIHVFFKICASVKFPRKVAFYGYTTKIALVTLPRVCLIGLKSQMNYIFLPSSVTQRAFEKILFRAVSILVDVLFCFVLPLLSCLIESYLLFISTISYH